jgi:putative FmdB family regulatory protein
MPTYLYECKTCEQRVSINRAITEQEIPPVCIECAKPMLKQYGLTGVTFKGTGWGKDAN